MRCVTGQFISVDVPHQVTGVDVKLSHLRRTFITLQRLQETFQYSDSDLSVSVSTDASTTGRQLSDSADLWEDA